MFETLAKGFRQARNRLAGLTELSEGNIEPALREVRLSLLEADVEIGVVKAFLARVKQKAVGQTLESRVKVQGETHQVSASDLFIKICHDELEEMMESGDEPIVLAESGPTGIMMVGLQGSGKTTSCAKLARYLEKQGKRPLLVAADMQRPAAVDQLKVLGEQLKIPVFNLPGESPVAICAAARAEAKRLDRDVIVYDTAGRLAIDEPLMAELAEIKSKTSPENIFLVVDAMIGQDAVKTSRAFHERLGVSGVVLTKLDGDARGGAALSIKAVTGAPVVFAGMGETTDKLELFRADGMASRILGMGDVVGLMQNFEEVIDQKKAEEDATRLLQGDFTLEDFLEQVRMIQKMGSLKDLVDKLPLGGMFPGGLPQDVNLDDRELTRIEAMIQSMTRFEKGDPYALIREPRRVERIAKGSGSKAEAVTELVQKFLFMKQMMGGLGQNLGLMGKIPGMKQMAMARNMKKMMGGAGGMPGFPGMGGMPGFPGMGFPGMGMPGMGMPGMGMPGMGGPEGPSMTKMKTLSPTERNAKKAQRKRERDARKKGPAVVVAVSGRAVLVLALVPTLPACDQHQGSGASQTAEPGDRQTPPAVVSDPRRVIKELDGRRVPSGAVITIDGRLDEPAWREAKSTGPFVDVGSGRENPGLPTQGSARLLWDDQFLYVGFEVADKKVHGGWPPGAKDAHLWEKDTVEVMIDPDGDGDNKDYYEIQINPQNLVFDTQYDGYNSPNGNGRGPFGHEEWSANLTSAVVVHGTIDDDSDVDQGYTVEAKIPWASFTKAQHAPPLAGSTWRMNFYAMKNNGGTAWSPILGMGNFHLASRFGRVRWVGP